MKKIDSVLLIDDDEATNFINELLIRKTGITSSLSIARNGKDALELLYKCKEEATGEDAVLPKLILLDINMPVLDGFGFLESFEALDIPGKESVVIVVLTTSLNPKDVERVQVAGVNDFVNKPLTRETLQHLVAKHFN